MQYSQKGFGAAGIIAIIVTLTIIGGTGFYLAQMNKKKADHSVKSTQSAQTSPKTETPKSNEPKLTQYEFKQEKLKFAYNSGYWNKADERSGITDCQPGVQIKHDSLSLKHNDFGLGFNFGTCSGKGGGQCFYEPNSSCIRESLNLGEIKVSGTKSWYILASRASIDSKKTWQTYSLTLYDKPECTGDVCFVTATNIDDETSSIGGSYTSHVASGATTLEEYAQLPEVKAAVEVLKTIRY